MMLPSNYKIISVKAKFIGASLMGLFCEEHLPFRADFSELIIIII